VKFCFCLDFDSDSDDDGDDDSSNDKDSGGDCSCHRCLALRTIPLLLLHEARLYNMLQKALDLATHVFIVTNSGRGWVEQSVEVN
jgi:hypothetical protein